MKTLLLASIVLAIHACAPNEPTYRLKIEKHPVPTLDYKIRFMKFFLI